jgi:serine-type D-Ala-D-Ala carboxypeptidase (penicillin-binding protein 5/6)
MKKHGGPCVVIFVAVLLSFVFMTDSAFAKRAARRGSGRPPAAAQADSESKEPCKAYVVMDARSGQVLEEQNMHARRAPASMAKLMVAYIVLDKLARGDVHLNDNVAVSEQASKIGGSQVYLKAGETFSLEDMMRAIMVASANDAAHAVSEFVSGSNRDFVDLMNEKAKALGMNDTEFCSVHGLPPSKDQKEDMTSAYDMALLARALLKYPKIIEWTSIREGEFRNGAFKLTNHNKMLWKMPEVDGLKTGFYASTGYNVTATARKGELRFITVVMGSPTNKKRDDFAMERFRKWFAEYTVLPLVKKGEPVEKEVILVDGRSRKIKGIAAYDLNLPILRAKKKEVKRVVSLPASIRGEVKQGQKLGEILFQLDNQTVGKADIISPVAVPKANLFTRMVRKVGLNL